MCRIFGFRSVLFSRVHTSLISADNALISQSDRHPDGWGVAYYVGLTPHIIRSINSALEDALFKKISGIVTSQTVLAHIRKATKGELNILNTHPFQYGNWTFAHNGNITNFASSKAQLIDLIDPQLKHFILGDTDSEIIFYILLSHIKDKTSLEHPHISAHDLSAQITAALLKINKIIGPLKNEDRGFPTQNYLTFVMSNGKTMIGLQAGQPLYFTTHKKLCPERDECSFLNRSCENPSSIGDMVNHLIFSSEPLQGENIWNKMNPGQMILVDEQMQLHHQDIELEFLT